MRKGSPNANTILPLPTSPSYAQSIGLACLLTMGSSPAPCCTTLATPKCKRDMLARPSQPIFAQKFGCPGDAKLAENLAHARSLVRTRVDTDAGTAVVDRLLFWHSAWSPTLRLTLFAFAWIVLWGVLATQCWRRVPGLRTTMTIAGVASVAFGLSVAWPLIAGESPIGVLVQDDVIVRKGDNNAFEPRFQEPIHQGVEFRVLESRPQWLHIELPDGQDGWVPRDATELVGHSGGARDGALAGGAVESSSQS